MFTLGDLVQTPLGETRLWGLVLGRKLLKTLAQGEFSLNGRDCCKWDCESEANSETDGLASYFQR